MRNLIWTCVTISFFFLLILSFGLPKEMELINRKPNNTAKILVGDKQILNLPETLSGMNADLILLGSSMLGEAVSQEKMSQALGISTSKVWLGGSGSAWWYLVTKNVLPELPHKPKYLGIFFRDNYLTLPQHKTSGKHKSGIDSLAGKNEEVLDRLAYFNSMNFVELALQKNLPLLNHRERIKEKFEQILKKMTAMIAGLANDKKVDELIAIAFDNAKMDDGMLHRRQIADELAQDEYRKDMRFRPDRSFLTSIIRLCEEQDVTLFFVRVKRVRDLKPHKQNAALLNYISRLGSYLAEQNIPLIDFTDNRQIQKKHFGRGDHLNRGSGRVLFTELLAQQIKNEIIAGEQIATLPLYKN